MCGIAGILAPDGQPVDERVLRRMTRALAPRGPDGEGFHIEAGIGLGHRRLAVIDVEGGGQPLYTEDRQAVAVVNGEFYNYRDLRAELIRGGHHFSTATDSEVLLHGYEAYGLDVLDHLEGMFAFALWDRRTHTLFLARDRLGEKPLYWAELPRNGLAFASELKALRRYPGLDTPLDPQSLADYLVFEYVPAPRTMLRGVRKLPAAHALVTASGQVPCPAPYWDLPLPRDPLDRRYGAHQMGVAAEALGAALRRSVHQRLEADVPLGVFLSGGIDSSTVAALAAKVHPIDTFNVGFDDETYDESGAARYAARVLGTRHHEARLTSAHLLELLPTVGALLDEPIGDSSIVPTHLLARHARQHVTVALGGDGSDELFAGYFTFLAEPFGRLLFERIPAPAEDLLVAIAGAAARSLPVSWRYFSLDFKLRQFLKGRGHTGAHRHQQWLSSLAPTAARSMLLRDVAQEAPRDPDALIDGWLSSCPSPDPWDRLLYFYTKGYLADDILTKVDRATMAVGLEVRSPLLDRHVVELAATMAPALRCRGLETKAVLKRATRGLLPRRIRRRGKRGFGMPIGRWLRTELRDWVEEELGEHHLRQQGIFEPAAVRRLWEDHLEARADLRKPLWTLLAFQAWWRSLAEV